MGVFLDLISDNFLCVFLHGDFMCTNFGMFLTMRVNHASKMGMFVNDTTESAVTTENAVPVPVFATMYLKCCTSNRVKKDLFVL